MCIQRPEDTRKALSPCVMSRASRALGKINASYAGYHLGIFLWERELGDKGVRNRVKTRPGIYWRWKKTEVWTGAHPVGVIPLDGAKTFSGSFTSEGTTKCVTTLEKVSSEAETGIAGYGKRNFHAPSYPIHPSHSIPTLFSNIIIPRETWVRKNESYATTTAATR